MAEATGNQEYTTVLGPDATFKGELTFEKGMRLHGKLNGSVTTPGKLHVAREAQMEANVDAGGDHHRGCRAGEPDGRRIGSR